MSIGHQALSSPHNSWLSPRIWLVSLLALSGCTTSIPDISQKANVANGVCASQFEANATTFEACCRACSEALSVIVPGVTGWADAAFWYRISTLVAVMVLTVAVGMALARWSERRGHVGITSLTVAFVLPALVWSLAAFSLEQPALRSQSAYLVKASKAWASMGGSVSTESTGGLTCQRSIEDCMTGSSECLENGVDTYPGAYLSFGPSSTLTDDELRERHIDQASDMLMFISGTSAGQGFSTSAHGEIGAVLGDDTKGGVAFRSVAIARLGPLWRWPLVWPFGVLLLACSLGVALGLLLHYLVARRQVTRWKTAIKAHKG